MNLPRCSCRAVAPVPDQHHGSWTKCQGRHQSSPCPEPSTGSPTPSPKLLELVPLRMELCVWWWSWWEHPACGMALVQWLRAAGISPQWAPFPEVFHDTGNPRLILINQKINQNHKIIEALPYLISRFFLKFLSLLLPWEK